LRRIAPALCGIAFLVACGLTACGGGGVREYGTLTGQLPLVAISEILETPEIYLGRDVAIEGRVFQVCQEMGCWFEVAQSGRTLMVDLQMGRHFTIPENSAGMMARCEGKLVRQDGVLKLIGSGVKLSAGASG